MNSVRLFAFNVPLSLRLSATASLVTLQPGCLASVSYAQVKRPKALGATFCSASMAGSRSISLPGVQSSINRRR
jgi:hypothetical protein